MLVQFLENILIMRTIFLLLPFVMAVPSQGDQSNMCTQKEACSTILFNRMALSNITDDMKELANYASSQLLKNAEEMNKVMINLRESIAAMKFQPEDLEGCRNELNDFHNISRDMELKYQELMSGDEGWEEDMEKLRNEKEDLIKSMEPLKPEKCSLDEQDAQQKEKIWNLTMVFYKPLDCADVQLKGNEESGVYTIYPYRTEKKPIDVLCDLESNGGGWTVFFTRQPQDNPIDFNESWENFKKGFGNVNSEYWLGNDLLHLLTSYGASMLRIDAEDYTGDKRWAEWTIFNVGDEANKYQLTLEEYQTTSTMGDSFSEASNKFFTTFDMDNDEKPDSNCAIGSSRGTSWGKGGWWYKDCGTARPTAPLMNTNYWNSACYGHWDTQGMKMVSLNTLTVKFRRLNYKALADISVSVPNQKVESYCL